MITLLLWPHIAAGIAAILLGAVAVAVRKGGLVHRKAGAWFVVAMLVLGVTAAILEPFRPIPGSPIAGILPCYFVATSWATVRRRNGRAGSFEIAACTVALGLGALLLWSGLTGTTTPAGSGPLFAVAGVCLLAGLLDLSVILREQSPAQRVARHLWRMCFALFIATGSFFLGQQKVMPKIVHGSPVLFVLAFAPFAVMLFWLVHIQLAKQSKSNPAGI